MRIKLGSHKNARVGIVIGELLVAILLLAVAVSSLAALMYSVSRRTDSRTDVECASASAAGRAKCAQHSGALGAAALLRSPCATKDGAAAGPCEEPSSGDSSNETMVRSRTDSVALAIIAKKQKHDSARTDRGFIR